MDDALGFLVAAVAVIALIVMVIMYIIVPLLAIIAVCGLCYGGFFAIANYAAAFNDITIEGNSR